MIPESHIRAFIVLVCLAAAVALFFVVIAVDGYGAEYHLDYSLTFAPPHNEPIPGDKVARYRAQLVPSFDSRWLSGSLDLQAWGVNTWQADPGHGPEAWGGSDWSVEEWRVSTMTKLWFWPAQTKKVGVFSEYYLPLDRRSWGSNPSLSHYYWLVGVGGRFL